MINFKMIRNFLNTDKRFSYTHDLLNDNIEVFIKNSESKFTIIRNNHGIKVILGIGSLTGIFKVSFNVYDMTSFKEAVETIYRSSTIEDEQPKEVKPSISVEDIKLALDAYNYTFKDYTTVEGDAAIAAAYGSNLKIFISRDKDKWLFQCKYLDETNNYREDDMEEINEILLDYASLSDYNEHKEIKDVIKYPRGGNTMYKQPVNKSNDFLNDYKVVKLAEKAINDNFAELANDFIKYSGGEEDISTILSCGNSKVLFSATKFNRKITIEFGRDGEEPFRYVYTNKGINLLNDYDPKALITIGNLIEAAVESWLERDRNRINMEDVNECMISAVDNIKTMIGLINSTIGKYSA